VLVVAHHAVLRVIACYFGDKSPEEVPDFDIKPNTVLKLTPQAYGCNAEVFEVYPDAPVDDTPRHPLNR
jgi:6-phosphofructo-2-kinase/fructose-2,6-biphosphatase 2